MLALAAALATAAALPAGAAPVSPSSGDVSVDLVLAPTSTSGLHALATAHNLSRSTRAARLLALTPTDVVHQRVAATLAAAGLSVDQQTDWSMRVSGPASTVQSVFGTHAAKGLTGYSRVPGSLAGLVTAALPTGGPRAWHTRATTTRNGTDFRTAYDIPSTARGSGLTVATVQFSGWDSSVLSTYISQNNLQTSMRYTGISVDGASRTAFDGSDGQIEVALDQESILSTAPNANQRAYFAPNDAGGGFIHAVQQVAQDAAANHIGALSLSWGGCMDLNPSTAEKNFYIAADQALQLATAAGVTVFAASGDWGSHDCVDANGIPTADNTVDYPAASTYVVGVGGTTLPDPAHPSTATAWQSYDPTVGANAGSGGGEADAADYVNEAQPSWQAHLVPSTSGRLVPDISSDAAQSNGFVVVASNTDHQQYLQPVGGTSLAAPTQAALFTDALSAAGFTQGVGDIHQDLYATAAGANYSTSFTDITSGNNGAYHAGTGYDMVTGLGTPLWTHLVSHWYRAQTVLPDRTNVANGQVPLHIATFGTYTAFSAPVVNGTASCVTPPTNPTAPTYAQLTTDGTATVSVAVVDGNSTCTVLPNATTFLDRKAPSASVSMRITGVDKVLASWSGSDPAPSSGGPVYSVAITYPGGGKVYVPSGTTTATSYTIANATRSQYTAAVTPRDAAGNAGRQVLATVVNDNRFTYGSGWTAGRAAGYYDGDRHVTTRSGAYALLTGTGSTYVVYVTTCATCGKLAVYYGRTLVKTISLTTNRTHTLVPVTVFSANFSTSRTLSLRNVAASSRAHTLYLDAATIR